MCTPSAPKPAPVVTPPPASLQAKPLGVDTDEASTGGIASLRASGTSGLSIRKAAGGNNRAGAAVGAGSTSGTKSRITPSPATPSSSGSYIYDSSSGGE